MILAAVLCSYGDPLENFFRISEVKAVFLIIAPPFDFIPLEFHG